MRQTTVKILNLDTWKSCCNHPRIKQGSFTVESTKDAKGIANSVDPDQTYLSENLGSLQYVCEWNIGYLFIDVGLVYKMQLKSICVLWKIQYWICANIQLDPLK